MARAVKPFEVTHWSVIAIAWPTTLAFLSTPLLGLVDMAVVGRLGSPAMIGGLAVGAILFDIIFTTFNFLRASTTGLVAQAVGAQNDAMQKLVLIRSLLLSVLLGMIPLAISPFILSSGLWAMEVTPAVAAATSEYFSIRILAAPLTLINYSALGWMLGRAQAGLALVLQSVLNGTNIVLSVYLGLHLEMGLAGVGWATVIAEAIAVMLGLTLVWRAWRGSPAVTISDILDRSAIIKMLAVNRDIMIRSFVLLFTFAFITAQGARFGELTLAANAVLLNFFMFGGFLLDGFATAAEQLAGRGLGANYRPAFDRAVRLSVFWGFVLAIIATIVFWFGGPYLIDFLTTDSAVRSEARTYLFWAAITVLLGNLAFQMDGVFIGATWSVEMRNMMILSLIAFLAVWWIAVPLIGNHGLWLALEVFLSIRGITLLARLKTKADQSFDTAA